MMPARIIHRVRPDYPDFLTQAYLRKLRMDFLTQRASAKDRGIGFDLSYSEWLGIWIASGKLLQRGRRRGQYVMARIGDRGAYRIGNVEIIPHAENVRQFHLGKIVSTETCRRISAAKAGKPKSLEHRAKLSRALTGRSLQREQCAKIAASNRLAWIRRRARLEARP
jgi:NUMOD3 motif